MANVHEKRIFGTPVVEGLRLRVGSVDATAVRNRNGNVTLRVGRQNRLLRNAIDRIPLVRGAFRPFYAAGDLIEAVRGSEILRPAAPERGLGFEEGFARLFRIMPETHVARLSGLAMLLIVGIMLVLLPWLAGLGLIGLGVLDTQIIDGAVFLTRFLGMNLSIWLCARLRVMRRLCRWRTAAGRVINAYEIYGKHLTLDEVRKVSVYTATSNGVFMLIVLAVSMLVSLCLPATNILLRIPMRAAILLGVAAVIGELHRSIEEAPPRTLRVMLRKRIMRLQGLWLQEPDDDMLEVAMCAFEAISDELA